MNALSLQTNCATYCFAVYKCFSDWTQIELMLILGNLKYYVCVCVFFQEE